MKQENVIASFCKAREAHLNAKRERLDVTRIEKLHSSALTEQMSKEEVSCIALEDGFVRLIPGPKRSMKLKTLQDVLDLTSDIERHITEVPREHVPVEVVNLVKRRALDRGPPPSHPHLITSSYAQRNQRSTLVSTLPESMRETVHAFCSAKSTRSEHSELIRDLRKREVEAEKTMIPSLPSEGIVVQMKTDTHAIRITPPVLATKTGHVEQKQGVAAEKVDETVKDGVAHTCSGSAPDQQPSKLPCIGMRMLIPVLKKAAADAAAVSRSSSLSFDSELKRLLVQRLTLSTTPSASPNSLPPSTTARKSQKVVVRRVKRLAATTAT